MKRLQTHQKKFKQLHSPLDDLRTTCEWLPSKRAPNVCNEGNFGRRTPPSDLRLAETETIQTPQPELQMRTSSPCFVGFATFSGRFLHLPNLVCWRQRHTIPPKQKALLAVTPGLVALHDALAALWQDLTRTASFIHHQNLSEFSGKPWTMSKEMTLAVLQA